HPEEWAEIYAGLSGLPEEVVLASEERAASSVGPVTDEAVAAQQDQSDVYLEVGVLDERQDAAGQFDPSYNGVFGAPTALGGDGTVPARRPAARPPLPAGRDPAVPDRPAGAGGGRRRTAPPPERTLLLRATAAAGTGPAAIVRPAGAGGVPRGPRTSSSPVRRGGVSAGRRTFPAGRCRLRRGRNGRGAALPGRPGPAPPRGGSAHRARPRPGSGPFGAGTGPSRVPCPAKRVAAGPVRTGPPTAAAAPRSPRGSRPVQPACAGGRPRGRPPPRPLADAATGARGG